MRAWRCVSSEIVNDVSVPNSVATAGAKTQPVIALSLSNPFAPPTKKPMPRTYDGHATYANTMSSRNETRSVERALSMIGPVSSLSVDSESGASMSSNAEGYAYERCDGRSISSNSLPTVSRAARALAAARIAAQNVGARARTRTAPRAPRARPRPRRAVEVGAAVSAEVARTISRIIASATRRQRGRAVARDLNAGPSVPWARADAQAPVAAPRDGREQ